MDKPIENYWKIRLANLKEALEANNFEVFMADNTEDAKLYWNRLFPAQTRKVFPGEDR